MLFVMAACVLCQLPPSCGPPSPALPRAAPPLQPPQTLSLSLSPAADARDRELRVGAVRRDAGAASAAASGRRRARLEHELCLFRSEAGFEMKGGRARREGGELSFRGDAFCNPLGRNLSPPPFPLPLSAWRQHRPYCSRTWPSLIDMNSSTASVLSSPSAGPPPLTAASSLARCASTAAMRAFCSSVRVLY